MVRSVSAVVLACMLIPAALPASAAPALSPVDLALESGFLLSLAVDRSQTRQLRDFCKNRVGCTVHEVNPVLGKNPSPASINRYFFASALGHAIVSRVLPQPYRRAWQAGTLGLEVAIIGRNKRLGLRVQF